MGLVVSRAAESGERRRGHCRLLDPGPVVRFQVAEEPAGGDPRSPARVLLGDQRRQRERLAEGYAADLASGCLGNEQVAALDRAVEDRPRVALRGDVGSVPGPERRSTA